MKISKLVGMHFRPPAKILLGCLKGGAPLTLVPEPTNAFDSNAIAVFVETSTLLNPEWSETESLELLLPNVEHSIASLQTQEAWQLGYIPKEEAAEIVHLFQNLPLPCTLANTADGKSAALYNLTFAGKELDPDTSPLVDDRELD